MNFCTFVRTTKSAKFVKVAFVEKYARKYANFVPSASAVFPGFWQPKPK